MRRGALLFPDFERITLIDFAFSLVSGERLDSACRSPARPSSTTSRRACCAALDEGSRGNLWPTRLLDWRCDLFSLAAMLRRYLPEPDRVDACGWTAAAPGQARALVRRLLEAHDAELPAVRPHADLIALTDDELRDPELADSLRRGWLLGERSLAAIDDSPTPITRIALPLRAAGQPAALRRHRRGDLDRPQRRRGLGSRQSAAAEGPPAASCLDRGPGRIGRCRRGRASARRDLAVPRRAEPDAAPPMVAAPPLVADATPKRVASARVEPKTERRRRCANPAATRRRPGR